jgi:hypothetical protein
MSSLKVYEHNCSHCNVHLATVNNDGEVMIHVTPTVSDPIQPHSERPKMDYEGPTV